MHAGPQAPFQSLLLDTLSVAGRQLETSAATSARLGNGLGLSPPPRRSNTEKVHPRNAAGISETSLCLHNKVDNCLNRTVALETAGGLLTQAPPGWGGGGRGRRCRVGGEEVNTKCITKATQLPTLPMHPAPHLHRSPPSNYQLQDPSQQEHPCRGSKPAGILPRAVFNVRKAL